MNGGLSQVDSFDPKPVLDKFDGQPLPGRKRRSMKERPAGCLKSPLASRSTARAASK